MWRQLSTIVGHLRSIFIHFRCSKQFGAYCTFGSVFFFILLSWFAEPSDAGIIPPEYRTSFQPTNTTTTSAMTSQSVMMTSQQSTSSSPPSRVPPGTAGGQQEKNPAMPVKQPHQFSSNPVEEWAKEQVKALYYDHWMMESRVGEYHRSFKTTI